MQLIRWFTILSTAIALPAPGARRTLVVVDDTNPSVSLDDVSVPLAERGHEVTRATVRGAPEIIKYGERAFDNILIVPGTTKALGKTLTSKKLVEFMEDGGNIVCLSTPKFSPVAIRELAGQLGIVVSPRTVSLVDHFHDQLEYPYDSFILDRTDIVVGDHSSNDTATAVAHFTDDNDLVLTLAAAPHRSYAYSAANEDDEDVLTSQPFTTGNGAAVVAGFEGLNGARFVWTGSSEFLLQSPGAQLTSWAFQERHVLRVAGTSHKSLEDDLTHHHYRVGEELQYCIELEAWDSEKDQWVPYLPTDSQLEFTMLDPYYRLNLKPSDKDLCTSFKAPDQHGMFTFSFEYQRPGYTFLQSKEVVTMRHIANGEWARSWTITNSWVYLATTFSTIIAFLIFVYAFLTGSDDLEESQIDDSADVDSSIPSPAVEEKSQDTVKEKATKKHAASKKKSSKS